MRANKGAVNSSGGAAFRRLRSRLTCFLCTFFMTSCAHTQQVKTPPQPASQPSAMERQIRNAVDAGEGDYLVRNLQVRLASEPDNLAARMELARHYAER